MRGVQPAWFRVPLERKAVATTYDSTKNRSMTFTRCARSVILDQKTHQTLTRNIPG